MAKRETKAKRERDGWRVTEDKVGDFTIENGTDACWVYAGKYGVEVYAHATLTPARAAQFARKVAAIAARAAKEAKDGRA